MRPKSQEPERYQDGGPFTAQDLVRLARVEALAPRPDGAASVAVVGRLDEDQAKLVSDLWHVPHDGGPAARITRGDWKDRAPAFGPDGLLLFLSDRPHPASKDEARTQIWALPPGSEAYALSDEPHGVADFKVAGGTVVAVVELLPGVALEAQRKTLADTKKLGPSMLRYDEQPVRFWDRWLGPTEPRLVAWDLSAGPNAVLTERREIARDARDALRENGWDLAPDGGRVVITWAALSADRIHDKCLAVIDTREGLRSLWGTEPGVVHAAPRFAASGPDGAIVAQRYTRTPEGYAHRTLWCYRDGHGEELTASWDRWPAPWATTATHAITTAEDEGNTPLFLVPLARAGERSQLEVRRVGPNEGSWDQVARVPGRDEVVGVRSALLEPPEPYIMDLASGVVRPLARLSGFVPPAATHGIDVLRVEVAPDGARARTMSAFVVEPARPNGRTLLWIHGGPVAAWGDHWHWRWSALVMAEAGYRVIQPNPSGSTGYGMDWVNDIWGNSWGGRCYDDLMRLVARLEADGARAHDMAIMGGSFGGYMTNWIGSQTDRFRALVTHASIFHLSAFHGVTDFPAWWELMMRGSPWTDADYDRYSPSRYVGGWRTPTLILHGEKDYRVPIGEALSLFEALQAHGVPSELVVFPDENHWILKPRNAAAWYETVLAFLERAFGPGA